MKYRFSLDTRNDGSRYMGPTRKPVPVKKAPRILTPKPTK